MQCKLVWGFVLIAAGLVCGCEGGNYEYSPPATYLRQPLPGTVLNAPRMSPELRQQVLALDPDRLTDRDVQQVLSRCPAPRIINIHGGTALVALQMKSFSSFLVEMGYPSRQIRHPVSGAYSFSCYGTSGRIAGLVSWYYEREALRPMLIGHSQGGMEAVKVLHQLAGSYGRNKRVYNPMVGRFERRNWILDPYIGKRVAVVDTVQVCFASAVGAGGLTRLLPNQWNLAGKLRDIPDSAIDFTGFYIPGDLLGSDLLGLAGNAYRATGRAKVRTVLLPLGHDHYFVPGTAYLGDDPDARRWISEYQITQDEGTMTAPAGPAPNIVWAAEMWASVRKHWCLEVQRMVRAQQEGHYAGAVAGQGGGGVGVGTAVLDSGDAQRPTSAPADRAVAQP